MQLDLALVMPVYNEEECIADVVNSWLSVISAININFVMIVLNDGSKDGTAKELRLFADDSRLLIVNKENSGHGSTILTGYNKAVQIADWVFQCDSDDEMKATHFPDLWENRAEYDALFGIRSGREQNIARKIITQCSRFAIQLLFGSGVQDVNTPYRLMRASVLKQIVEQIPEDTFAPNIIISGVMGKEGLRVFEKTIHHENRKTGTASLVKWNLWRAAMKALWQTLFCRPKINIK